MKSYHFRKGLQAVAWLQRRLCAVRSPSTTGLAEEIALSKPSPFLRRPLSGSAEYHSFGSTIGTFRAGLHRIPPPSSPLHRGSLDHLGPFSGNRFYYTDSRGLQHFRRRGFHDKRLNPRQIVLIVVATTGLCVSIYFSNRETIPYTFRKHFVLVSPDLEIQLVENQFKALKEQWKPFILPPFHPESIRVRRIAKDIIQAVLEGVQLEDSHALELEHGGHVNAHKEDEFDVMMWKHDANDSISTQWGDKEEKFDDQWMTKSRKKGLKAKSQPFVEHLKNTKWEVLVVDKDVVNAFCLPGGKIVVFTGLLKRFPSDKEIATVLSHEVAHVVARHSAERLTRHLFVTLVQLFLLAFFYAPDLVQSMSVLFLELPFSRSQELEADHIGLLLMAAAGYDPRAAPYVYEKLGEVTKSSELLQYVTTHPSGKKRGERLRTAGTMEEALQIYTERTQGMVIEGFLRPF